MDSRSCTDDRFRSFKDGDRFLKTWKNSVLTRKKNYTSLSGVEFPRYRDTTKLKLVIFILGYGRLV